MRFSHMNTTVLSVALGAAVLATSACSDASYATAVDVEPTLSREAAAAAKPGPLSIAELASATAALSTLDFALEYSDANCGTNFGATLSGGAQYTVFAPTNAAFAAAIDALGAATVLSCDVLPTVLAFHVTPGRHTSTSVLARKQIRMLSGEVAAVEGTTVAGAPLNLGLINISARNGIVHVVDAVLLPPSILAALQ